MIKSFAVFTVLASLVAAPAAAVTAPTSTIINGDTTGAPTWNRTLSGTPPTSLSSLATAVPYDVTGFTVTTSGIYDFRATASYDNYLHLYQNAFNPLSQLSGVLVANDDFPDIGVSGFSASLLSGTSYFAVASAFDNSDFGAYRLEITGPGSLSLINPGSTVPEPASWAMLISGFGLIGATMRRRRSKTVSA